MEIQQLLLDETTKFISSFVKKSIVTIDGVEKEFPIHREKIDGNMIKKYVYLSSDTGLVTEGRLIDAQGRNIMVKSMSVRKSQKGLAIVFQIELKLEGV